MRFSIALPVFTHAKPAGARSAKPCVLLVEQEFEIPEIEAHEAPTAFVISRNAKGVSQAAEIKGYDGRLFRTTTDLADGIEAKMRPDPLARNGPLARVREAVASRMFRHEGQPVNPSGIVNAMRGGGDLRDGHLIVSAVLDLSKSITIGPENQADIDFSRAIVEAELARLIVVEGTILSECGEPFYRLGPSSITIKLSHDSAQQYDTSTYSANEKSEAFEAHRARVALSDSGVEPLSEDEIDIEVYDQNNLNWRGAEIDLDTFARRIDDTIGESLHRVGTSVGNTARHFRKVPTDVFTTWTALRDLLAGYDPLREGVPETLGQTLRDAIDAALRYDTTVELYAKVGVGIDEEIANERLERWETRPIGYGHGDGLLARF
jgi:hypothetical protein